MSWVYAKFDTSNDPTGKYQVEIPKFVSKYKPKADGIHCILQRGIIFHCWVRTGDKDGSEWEMQLYPPEYISYEGYYLFRSLIENELVVPIEFNWEASPKLWYFRKKTSWKYGHYDRHQSEILEDNLNTEKPLINKMHILFHKGTYHYFYKPEPGSGSRYDVRAEINPENDQIENVTNLLNANQGIPIEFDDQDNSKLWLVVKKT